MLNFTINKQTLNMDGDVVVADTIKYLTATFTFSNDWNGYTKILHIKKGGEVYDFPITSDKITEADNFSLTEGKWEIYLHGTKNGARVTTTSVMLVVRPFGNKNGEMYPNVPQSVLDRLLLVIKWNGDGTKFLADDGTYKAIDSAVAEYLEEHPISVPSKTSELTNDSGYITETALDDIEEDIEEINEKLDGVGGTETVDVELELTTGQARYISGNTWNNAWCQWGKGLVGGNVEVTYSGKSSANVNIPAIAFYDSNDTLLGTDGGDGTVKVYTDKTVTTPTNTAYAIVNGAYNTSSGLPKLSYTKNKGIKEFVEETAISNPLKNKKIVCIGDSIVKGQGYDGTTSGNKSYVNMIAERNDMTCVNYAVSGATICSGSNTSVFHICDNIATMDADADYVVVGGGYNDHTYRTPMGTITEDYTTELSENAIKTIIGGTEKLCRELLSRYPNKKILFVFSHKINDTPYSIVTSWDSTTRTMTDVHDKMAEVLRKYSIPYVDLFNESRLNTAISSFKTYTANADGTHPTKLGYDLFYCNAVESKLRSI